jgi:hypothetical protein
MSEREARALVDSPQTSSALLFCDEQTTPDDRNLSRLLDFFSIPWKSPTVPDPAAEERGCAIVITATRLAEAMQLSQGHASTLPPWVMKASTVYVHGFQDDNRSNALLQFLTGCPQANLRRVVARETNVTVTDAFPEMCGPMSGLRVPVTLAAPGYVCDGAQGGEAFQGIVRADEGEVFFGVTCAGVRFYLNTWGRTIDIDAPSAEYFDVKKFFCESVPLVLYLKWAFRDTAWGRSETSACLVVDDPPLKRRYGFLDFREALDLMDRHNFTMTTAFIPWNWRRSHPGTLGLFKSRPDRLSLAIHGCDHTAREFAVRSPDVLNRKLQTSMQRMRHFHQRNAFEADLVMVFPQGEFSPETGRALKLNGFVAAVNTEVAPSQPAANQTTIADLWSVAIMRYGSFPIFTRRYARQGIENFAFDALLGKPCLITAHHDVFRDHARNLVDFVTRLNSLKWKLVWRPLGEAVRRSFAFRRLEDGTTVVRMFASTLVLENSGSEARRNLLLKEEGDPESIEAVWVNEKPVEFSFEEGHLRVRLTTLPGETAVVRVAYRNTLEEFPHRDSSGTKVKVAAKRYLSEFRDNYLSRSDFLYQSASRLKHLMK